MYPPECVACGARLDEGGMDAHFGKCEALKFKPDMAGFGRMRLHCDPQSGPTIARGARKPSLSDYEEGRVKQ